MHDTDTIVESSGDLEVDIAGLTRVEGEGSLRLQVRDGFVEAAELRICEAPRYFEQLVAGRTADEVIDIVARICGICPIAYQMTVVHAVEDAFGVRIEPSVRALRRLMYCGEWIESHALHVYLLHLPDFLGYPSALDLATDHRETVEAGLRLKRTGNRIVELVGGRAIHPVSVRVGGFSAGRPPSPGVWTGCHAFRDAPSERATDAGKCLGGAGGTPPGTRTQNLQIKSLLL